MINAYRRIQEVEESVQSLEREIVRVQVRLDLLDQRQDQTRRVAVFAVAMVTMLCALWLLLSLQG